MINSLLSFGARSVNPKFLEQTLTVRRQIVDEIEKECIEKIRKNNTYQSLIIAPRGSGKTHIVNVLYHRLKNNPEVMERCIIAYMSEDEVGITDFTDLIVSIMRTFIRYNVSGSEILINRLEDAADITNTNQRMNFIKSALNEFANKRSVILLIENFDTILEVLGKNGQAELRDFLHQYNNLSILATSQNLTKDIQNSDYPFFNFFKIFHLKKLSLLEAENFFRQIAIAEENAELLTEMETPAFEGKLKAIYDLTEGNHRLLVTFYSFLKAEFKAEFSYVFIKVMNDLKPYYEQFINALAPQQQKIVKFLSQQRRAVNGREIARSCFIESRTLSKQTSILYEQGMIDKSKSGKDVYYELKEPLMRISFEISDNPNGIASLFASFLSAFYEPEELGERFLQFKFGAEFQSENLKSRYLDEANLYLMALPFEIKEKLVEKFDLLQSAKDHDELQLKIKEIKAEIFGEQIFGKKLISMFSVIWDMLDSKDSKITDSATKFLNEFPNEPFGYVLHAIFYESKKRHTEALNYLQKGFEISANNPTINVLLAHVYFNLGEMEQVVKHTEILLKSKKNKTWFPEIKNKRAIAMLFVADRTVAKSNFSQLLKENGDRNNKKLIRESLNILFNNSIRSDMDIEFFKLLIIELRQQNFLVLFWPELTTELFNFLRNMENSSVQDVSRFEDILHAELCAYQESIIPLKMLNVGINYLKKENKNALFELSKEERALFKSNVLDKKTQESKKRSLIDIVDGID
jgi:DNA-binding transcriptional ArsR family regulator